MPLPSKVLTKEELYRIIPKFLKDENRGISFELFSSLCGISHDTLKDVFIHKKVNMSERVQRRVSKGYQAWMRGEVAVMQKINRERFVDYRKEPKPRIRRHMGLQVVNGQIKMKIGLVNKSDYSDYDIDEQLRGKHG